MKNNALSLRSSLVLFSFISIFAFGGCSIWENFTTYFNLYYNASDKFEEAEKLILAQKKDLFQMQETKPPSNAGQGLTVVIEKLSKLLQFYNKSSYVDNSLLMIGKSFYYQQDYIKASRKFDELITTFPESDLTLEALLWSGKTQLRQNKFDEALKTLELVKEKAIEQDENEILTEAYTQHIAYLIYKELYPEAISNIVKLIEVSEDDEKNAAIMYELGKLYVEINDLENAAKAFADVQKFSPSFEIDYKSKLEYGKSQRELDKNEAALEIFEDIKSESVYNDYLDQTELEIGITLLKLKRLDDAFDLLTKVDSTYRQLPSSGIASYSLGTLMETEYHNFDSANVYYGKAITSSAPLEYIELAKKKNAVLKKYESLTKSIDQFNRQMIYLKDSTEFIKDSIAFAIEQSKRDSIAKEKAALMEENEDGPAQNRSARTTEGRQTRQQRQQTTQKTNQQNIQANPDAPVMPKISQDSLHAILAKNEYELAGLFFTELKVIDSAYIFYQHILSEHPNTSYTARTIYALGSYYQTKNDTLKADSLFEIVYNNYKSENIVNAAANQLGKPVVNFKYDPAEELYLAAENKMKEEKYNEAVTEFLAISDKYPKSSLAPKAMLAGGWILENKLKLLDSAAVVYDSVSSRYSKTKYATSINAKLSLYKTEQKKKQAVLDSIANANNPKPITQIKDSLGTKDTLSIDQNRNNQQADSLKTGKVSPGEKEIIPETEQEEFTPDVPPPVSDSLDQNIDLNEPAVIKPDSSKPVVPKPDQGKPDSLLENRKRQR